MDSYILLLMYFLFVDFQLSESINQRKVYTVVFTKENMNIIADNNNQKGTIDEWDKSGKQQ